MSDAATTLPRSTQADVAESDRLQALQACQLLDSPPQPAWEALARLAAQLSGAPMAWVGWLDSDRLWFQARVGIDSPELPRAVALCAHTVAQPDQPLVLNDLAQDPRWAAHARQTGVPPARSYAGVVVRDPQGWVLGTVAVMDHQPRVFSPAQLAALQDLALLAGELLQGRLLALQAAAAAQTDPATGLPDQTQFDATLDVELRHAMRTGEPFTVVQIALEGLDDVLQGFGPAAADQALQQLVGRLKQQVRLGDLLARLDNGQFGVVMRHGGESSAEALSGRVTGAVQQPIVLDSGDTVGVGVSIGIAPYSDAVLSATVLVDDAARALAQSRAQNGGQWQLFGKLLDPQALRLPDAGL